MTNFVETIDLYTKSNVSFPSNIVTENSLSACNYNCQCDCGRTKDCCNNCYVKCS